MKGIEAHLHRRKRRAKNTEPFPSPSFRIRMLDRIAIAAGIIGPVMTLPQIYDIYSTHSAAGVSALSWLAFGLLDIPFILYGVVHRDRLILVTYILWCIANFAVAIGAIIYHV
jgi:MtN3 and saliva related transmembrane protein